MHTEIASKEERISLLINSRLMAFVFAIALMLSISTNTRWAGLPFGIGEIILVAIMTLSLLFRPWKNFRSPVFLFWIALWLAVGAGSIFGVAEGSLRFHNTAAYVFTGLLTLGLLTIFERISEIQLQRIAWYFMVIVNILLWSSFALYVGADEATLNLLNISIADGRFQGWCQNANQMSLLMAPLPFIALGLWDKRSRVVGFSWHTLVFVSLLTSTIVLGLVVRSDALGFAWILGVLVLWLLNIRKFNSTVFKKLVGITLCFALGFFVVRMASLNGWLLQGNLHKQEVVSAAMYQEATGIESLRVGHGESRQKVDIRLQLWNNAIDVWKTSILFGHGPGAYSNFDMDETHSYQGMEAHNTIIDLGVQGGLFLALAYIGFAIWILATIFRSGCTEYFVAILVLFAFEFFMFHLRQPILWFYFCLILTLAKKMQEKNA